MCASVADDWAKVNWLNIRQAKIQGKSINIKPFNNRILGRLRVMGLTIPVKILIICLGKISLNTVYLRFCSVRGTILTHHSYYVMMVTYTQWAKNPGDEKVHNSDWSPL